MSLPARHVRNDNAMIVAAIVHAPRRLTQSVSWPYSAEAARNPAMSIRKVTAHQSTSVGTAEIIAYTHRGLTRQAAKL
jgi:hypothetical protein